VLPPPGEHRDVADLREVTGVEASDGPGADDADSLDHAVERLRMLGCDL
jgi:hypothetical protein